MACARIEDGIGLSSQLRGGGGWKRQGDIYAGGSCNSICCECPPLSCQLFTFKALMSGCIKGGVWVASGGHYTSRQFRIFCTIEFCKAPLTAILEFRVRCSACSELGRWDCWQVVQLSPAQCCKNWEDTRTRRDMRVHEWLGGTYIRARTKESRGCRGSSGGSVVVRHEKRLMARKKDMGKNRHDLGCLMCI